MEPLELISTAPKRRKRVPVPATSFPVARVLVDSGVAHLDHSFDYLISTKDDANMSTGVLVRVPFSGRTCDGIVIARVEKSETQRLKFISSVISNVPVVTQFQLRLIQDVAEYFVGTFWDVVRSAVPPRHAKGEREAGEFTIDLDETDPTDELTGRALSFLAASLAGKSPRALLLREHSSESLFGELLSAMLQAGQRLLVIVPEQADVNRLEQDFHSKGFSVLGLHAGLASQERYRKYLLSQRSEIQMVIGTRSALFSSGRFDAIVLVDEENHSYQEARSPGWFASKVADIRTHLEGASLLLYAPALPIRRYLEILDGELHILNQSRPPIKLLTDHSGVRVPTMAWKTIKQGLESGPVLVTVARKGYVPGLLCIACGNRALCECGGPLVQLSSHAITSCHLCQKPSHWQCPLCHGYRTRSMAKGSELTAEELGKAFPGVAVHTSTSDRRIEEVDDSPKIVIATGGAEPRTKNGYSAVILLDGDFLAGRAELDAIGDLKRRWLASISLMRSDGTVFASLPDSHPVVKALLLPHSVELVGLAFSERAQLRLPPACVAVITEPAPQGLPPEGVRLLGSSARGVLTCSWSEANILRTYLKTERDSASIDKRSFSFRFDPYYFDERGWGNNHGKSMG